LPTLVAETNAIFSKKCLAKRLTFLCNVELNVPEKLCGDEKKFRQLLINLVGNAIKFTEFGNVQTRYSVDETHADTVLLRVEIEDTGIGISPDSAAKLFAPFQQADNSTTRRYGGTGLGLAICKQLAEVMGGEIGLRSNPGAGSLFWFTIRLGAGVAVASDQAHLEPPTQAVPEAAEAVDTERLQGLRKMLGARFDELVDKFETNAHIIMDRMQAATEMDNTDELMRAAHSLKGSSGTIGATVMFRVSSELEAAARLGPVADAAVIVAHLRAECARFHDAVAQLKHA